MEIVFWKDKGSGVLAPDLFAEQAEKWASAVYQQGQEDRKNSSKINKSSQIRRFYDEVLRFDAMVAGAPADEFERQLPYIRMLQAKVSYAEARDLVSPLVVEMIRKGVGSVESPADFKAFKLFFEAFMGYYKVHSPRG